MKIQSVEISSLPLPLKKPFKIAFWVIEQVESLVVKMTLEDGTVGYGTAVPTAPITGDTVGSIRGALSEVLIPQLVGMDVTNYEEVLTRIDGGIVRNSSARAALDIAVYDLVGKLYSAPLYKLLGGYKNRFETDVTVSIDSPEQMALDAKGYMADGFRTLKVKVGIGGDTDVLRVKSIREAIGKEARIRLDANQGWSPKEAVRAISKMEDLGLDIELVEQPVKYADLEGLKFVTDNVLTPIMADESVFSPQDALKVISMRAADLINIKLMKSGGIYNALKINALAESAGMECMIGCMIENRIGMAAAAHFAAAKKNVTRMDLDSSFMVSEETMEGGFHLEGPEFVLFDAPGIGIKTAQ